MIGLLGYIYKFFEYNIMKNVEEIKSVDLYFNQFETQDNGESDPRANPRVLVEVMEFIPLQGAINSNIQMWTSEIVLHIGIDIINTFYSKSELQDKNLAYLTTLDNIYNALSSESSYDLPEEIYNSNYRIYSIERAKVKFATNEGSTKVSEISFMCIIEDLSRYNPMITNNVELVETNLTFVKNIP